MNNRQDWEIKEQAELRNLLREVDNQTLAERKSVCIEWQRDLATPSLIAQRVQWLFAGNYGHGAKVKAIEMANSRGNVAAQLGGLIAAVEWRCPNRETRAAWNRLTQTQQVAVNNAIDEEVKDWRREENEIGSNPTPRIRAAKVRLAYSAVRSGRSQKERNQRLVAAQLMHRKMKADYGDISLPPLNQTRNIIRGNPRPRVRAASRTHWISRDFAESVYHTWEGWKRAAKKAGALYIDGNKDIAQAFKSRSLNSNGHYVGKNAVGEWDGATGYVAVREAIRSNPTPQVPALEGMTPLGLPKQELELEHLGIYAIARIISRNWKNVNYAAKPYLDAMFQLNSINDNYYNDSGRSILAYFLNNASSWKGETAKAVKAELKRRLKSTSLR